MMNIVELNAIPHNAFSYSLVDTVGCTDEDLRRLVIIARRLGTVTETPSTLFVFRGVEVTVVGLCAPEGEARAWWVATYMAVEEAVDDDYLAARDSYGDHDLDLGFAPDLDFEDFEDAE